MKFTFTYADNDDLTLLLKPTDKLVGILTGSNSVYHLESGYFHEHLNIVIDKSCSGYNFWLLSFLLFTYLALKHFDRTLQKIIAITTALIFAYLLTIFSTTSRIFTSIVIQRFTKNIFGNHQNILHEAIGIVTNLTFLILTYILIEKLLIYQKYNEKFA